MECLFKQNKGFSSETIGLGPRTKASVREENANYGERVITVHNKLTFLVFFSNLEYLQKSNFLRIK